MALDLEVSADLAALDVPGALPLSGPLALQLDVVAADLDLDVVFSQLMHGVESSGVAHVPKTLVSVSGQLRDQAISQRASRDFHWLIAHDFSHLSKWVSEWVETERNAENGIIVSEIIPLRCISWSCDNGGLSIWQSHVLAMGFVPFAQSRDDVSRLDEPFFWANDRLYVQQNVFHFAYRGNSDHVSYCF